jgi:serine/threonine-protein kinase
MTLSAGTKFAHYEISSLLGKGGMGEVYKAKDQKLGRDVAIKVLPEEFAKDADRVARFQREAKLLASLNHPNIAAIHGLEESNGTHFLVLELIEGDTLADRLKRSAIPVEESLKLALQIAEALEAAHEKGVIHRDLKPANIKVTPDGKVKVLDFGLAKAFAGEQSEANLSHSPTLSEAATMQGVILGTAAYMSPEQASGKTIDKRADIWAFGVVLFEMLTGRSLFAGDNVSQTLARVLERQPDFSLLPKNLHPKVGELLKRCLQKESKNRYHDIADIRLDLQEVLADPAGVLAQPGTVVEPRNKLRTILPWVAAAIIVAGVAVWYLKPSPPPEPKQVARFEYELPEGQQFSIGPGGAIQYTFAVSPDGSQFVYNTNNGLYLRSIKSLDARPIAGTDKDSLMPFFSPDGKSLGFWASSEQKLKKVAVSGGAPTDLCDTSSVILAPSWDSEDTILYTDIMSGIMGVSANGGTPKTLIEGNFAAMGEKGLPLAPQMLPDGKTLLFSTGFSIVEDANIQIEIQSLESGERKVVIEAGGSGRYLPTGHIVYSLGGNNNRNLFAVPFDLEKMEVTGDPVSVLEGVRGMALSESGTLVYVPAPAVLPGASSTTLSDTTLVWVDRQGKEEPLGAAPDAYQSLRISPDGTKIALAVRASGNNADIWIWDIPHKTKIKLTFDNAINLFPIWTPDGKRVVFYSLGGSKGLGGAYWKSEDGTGEAELLGSKPDRLIIPWSFSHDGKTAAIHEYTLAPLGADIGMMSMEGDREMKVLLQEEYWELEPQISPDGRYVAYLSDESGEGQIYVRSFPEMKGRWQVSNDGGNSPLWSPDGRELFYRNGDATTAVEVETDPTFKHGNPKILFRGTYLSDTPAANISFTPWDIDPDGKRFLMIKPPATAAVESTTEETVTPVPQPKIIVVLNWFEELKDRVPTD